MVSVVTDEARMFMPMAELVDLEKEARILASLPMPESSEGQIAKSSQTKVYLPRAPENVVNMERDKKAKLEALIENLKLSLEHLGK